ncbi:MAG: class I SAM-dependent methyltransferase [Roseibium sp.]
MSHKESESGTSSGIPNEPDLLSFFRYEWGIYLKLVRSNAMNHLDISALLRQLIDDRLGQPFSFLDLACGDAALAHSILEGTQVERYEGIDLNRAALDLAEENMKDVSYEITFSEEDMVAAVESRPETADMIWCGFSIHHLKAKDQKQAMLNSIYKALKPSGFFVCFEPTRHSEETRDSFILRGQDQIRERFSVLSDDEFEHMWSHIKAHDFPESSETWIAMGETAGFSQSREIFRMPGDLFCAAYLFEK